MAECIRSPLLTRLGFRHGFSLRGGGVSREPFASLNLGRGIGDVAEAVAENHARLAREVGYAPQELYEVSQVHGAEVLSADGSLQPAPFRAQQADALIATRPGIAVGVRTADCAAVLLAHPASGAVAAVHSGWRGTVLDVVGRAVARLCEQAQARAGELAAAIFPHIGPAAFEVGSEVADQIAQAVPDGAAVVQRHGTRLCVALGAAVQQQLRRAGLEQAALEEVSGCTFSDPVRFFSYRRDGAASGRHLAVIVAGC